MSANAYTSGTSWSWPADIPTEQAEQGTEIFPAQEDTPTHPHNPVQDINPGEAEDATVTEDEKFPDSPPKPQRHYPSRTCRICLEVVLPTLEIPEEGLPEILTPQPRVRYISQEAESGRLIRPCKCKGSQRYVHEGCLQSWRHADPAYGRRNYYECPTCMYRYQLERMRWSRWIGSTLAQLALTIMIMITTVFLLGFVADPILNLYLDPVETFTSDPLGGPSTLEVILDEDEMGGWVVHIMKGLASLGLLGAVKALFSFSPFFNFRLMLGGNRNGRAANRRERLENLNWGLLIIGILTFLWAVWKFVRSWSRKTLEKAEERVVDVQGDEEDDEYEDESNAPPAASNRTE